MASLATAGADAKDGKFVAAQTLSLAVDDARRSAIVLGLLGEEEKAWHVLHAVVAAVLQAVMKITTPPLKSCVLPTSATLRKAAPSR